MSDEEHPGHLQMAPFQEAFALFMERNDAKHEVWSKSGWMGMLVDIRKKSERLWYQYMQYQEDEDVSEEDLDSALDLLNYTAFFIRQVRANNRSGHWDWP